MWNGNDNVQECIMMGRSFWFSLIAANEMFAHKRLGSSCVLDKQRRIGEFYAPHWTKCRKPHVA
jgi:hypothetical protein